MTTPTDVRQLTDAALNQRKLEKAQEIQNVVQKVRDGIGEGGDPYQAMDAETRNTVKALMEDRQILETELGRRREAEAMRTGAEDIFKDLEQPLAAMPATKGQPGEMDDAAEWGRMSPGYAFVNSPRYQELRKAGAFKLQPNSKSIPEFGVSLGYDNSFPVHRKALHMADAREKALVHTGSAVGGSFIVPTYEMDAEPAARPGPDILNLLPVQRATGDTIYWMRQDTRSSAATTVSEATNTTGTSGTKPESTLAWSRQTTAVETIAVWIAVTNQQLDDAPEIRSVIDYELRYDVELQLDSQLLTGDGSSPNLTGLLNASIQALTYSTATYDNIADGLLHATVNVMTANEPEPTGIVVNPVQWRLWRQAKADGTGEYLAGPPMIAGQRVLWGYPLVVTNRMTSGKALVGNFGMARLHMREDANIKIGFADDDFINNRIRLLAELRAALTTRRPNAFCQVTALPTS